MIKLNEGDIVLCKVEKIEGTSVFVKIMENEKGLEGTIITSEIAPGRIRNIKDYVAPNKIIVCKVLRIDERGQIHLSLRRVTQKEKKEVKKKYEKEKSALTTLKVVLKDKTEEIARKIKKQESLDEFLQKAKDNPEILEQFMSKEEKEKIVKILKEKKEKHIELKKEFKLTSNKPNGINIIKAILSLDLKKEDKENTEIIYLTASRFLLKIKAKNYKQGNLLVNKILEEIEERAKKQACEFEFKEK